jgi:hypothetical protein
MSFAVLTFPEAMTLALATGAKVARQGWNGKGQHVRMTQGTQRFRFTLEDFVEYVDADPFMVLCNAQGRYVPWAPSQGDLVAVDWMELP